MRRIIFFSLIFLQITIIYSLTAKIQRQKNVLGEVQVVPIEKDSIIASPSGDLRSFYEPRPSHKEGQSVVGLPDLKAYYTINSDSLNERFEYQVEKETNVFRIATLGDSYTFGLYVNTENNYSEVLEDRFAKLACKNISKVEVINLGVGGYDIQYAVERFRVRGIKYNPDLLIWFIKDDDFSQIAEILNPIADSLVKKGYLEFDETSQKWPAVAKSMAIIAEKYSDAEIINMQKQYLSEIRNYYKNTILFLRLTPNREYSAALDEFIKKDQKSNYLIPSSINKEELRFIDFHPNEKGHQLIADLTYNFLIEEKMIPCQK